MKEFGLALHPDREEPIQRPRKEINYPIANDWAEKDRDFIVEQAQRVRNTFMSAWKTLRNGEDDSQTFAIIARALQQLPHIANPILEAIERQNQEAARKEEMVEAVSARADATKRLAQLAVEGSRGGNVIRFPRLRA